MQILSKAWYLFEYVTYQIFFIFFRLIEIVIIGLKAMYNELFVTAPHRIGRDFERYLLRSVFIKSRFDILHMTHDYTVNRHRYVRTSLGPDFKFYDRKRNYEFYVEAKYKSLDYYVEKVCICSYDQFLRYKSFEVDAPVYFAVGIKGHPLKPQKVAFIPISDLHDNWISYSALSRYFVNLPLS